MARRRRWTRPGPRRPQRRWDERRSPSCSGHRRGRGRPAAGDAGGRLARRQRSRTRPRAHARLVRGDPPSRQREGRHGPTGAIRRAAARAACDTTRWDDDLADPSELTGFGAQAEAPQPGGPAPHLRRPTPSPAPERPAAYRPGARGTDQGGPDGPVACPLARPSPARPRAQEIGTHPHRAARCPAAPRAGRPPPRHPRRPGHGRPLRLPRPVRGRAGTPDATAPTARTTRLAGEGGRHHSRTPARAAPRRRARRGCGRRPAGHPGLPPGLRVARGGSASELHPCRARPRSPSSPRPAAARWRSGASGSTVLKPPARRRSRSPWP